MKKVRTNNFVSRFNDREIYLAQGDDQDKTVLFEKVQIDLKIDESMACKPHCQCNRECQCISKCGVWI